jgi:hypothetical protein
MQALPPAVVLGHGSKFSDCSSLRIRSAEDHELPFHTFARIEIEPVRADIEVPERKLAVTWSLRCNTD